MARTFYHDFTKENGQPVTVEYSATGGEPYADLPGHICDGGGSGPEICLLRSWPNTQQYNDAFARRQELEAAKDPFRINDETREVINELSTDLARDEEAAELTDAERERMEAWLAENHEDEPDYDDWF